MLCHFENHLRSVLTPLLPVYLKHEFYQSIHSNSVSRPCVTPMFDRVPYAGRLLAVPAQRGQFSCADSSAAIQYNPRGRYSFSCGPISVYQLKNHTLWGLFHRQRTGSGTEFGSTFLEPGSLLRTGREPACVSTALNESQFNSSPVAVLIIRRK